MSYCMLLFHCCSWFGYLLTDYDHWSGRIVCSKSGNRLPEDAVLGIGLVSLASAVMLIMVGSIPFIGVIIPNLVSRIWRSSAQTIGVTALAGSLFLVFCDLVARVLIFLMKYQSV